MNNFTYKQVEVLNRVVALIENGADITKLTTSEIAARAEARESTHTSRTVFISFSYRIFLPSSTASSSLSPL